VLHPRWVRGASRFSGIPGVDGARAWPTPQGYLRRVRHRCLVPTLLTALDRVNYDPGPDPNDHDASDHLTGDQNPSRLEHGRNITEPDSCEHGDGEVQRVSTRQRLAEIVNRYGAHDEIGAGKQQQKQWNARRKSSDGPQGRIRRPDDRADLKGDQSNKRQKPDG
jgi:hypothetical protein